mmetsp:Transcript_685/g.505  ORF Transcript_685/g.505 Transcript_685/m.505 type:complete len:245 (+) Transcript_685:661-1395(+)
METEFLYGIHPVIETIKAKRRDIFKIYIENKNQQRFEKIVQLAQSLNIKVNTVKTDVLTAINKTKAHQGICAKTSPFPLSKLDELLESKNNLFVIIDNIVDPQNLGAIIRTALCASVDGIIIPKDRAASPTPTVSKVSAGALEHIKLAKVTNLVSVIKKLKEKNIWVAAMDMDGDTSVFDADLTVPLAIVIGSEELGVRHLVRKNSDFTISIPINAKLNSLNASAAAAIAIYEAYRQRKSLHRI